MPSPRTPSRRTLLLFLTCLLLSFALQIPLAWAFAWTAGQIFRIIRPAPLAATLLSPETLDTDAETISVESLSLPGTRVVTVMAHPPMGMSRRYLEHNLPRPNSPEVIAASEPWLPADLHPALTDLAAWPTRTGVYSRPNMSYHVPLIERHASGWPFLCVEGRILFDAPNGKFTFTGIYFNPRLAPPATSTLGQLCYQPRWPAYLANTAIHATLLTALLLILNFTIKSLRARHRQKRNRCPTCNYDLRATPTHQPCPECGRLSPRTPSI